MVNNFPESGQQVGEGLGFTPGASWLQNHRQVPLVPMPSSSFTTQTERTRGSLRLSGICALHLALQTGEQTLHH